MRIRRAKLTMALLATTVLGLGVIELQANLAARAQLRQMLGRHPGLTVAHVFAEPISGRLLLRDLRAGTGATRVEIGTLDLAMPRSAFGLIGDAVASPFDDNAGAPAEAPGATPPAPAAPPATAPTAATGIANASDVVITSGATTFKIKRIEATGTPLSNKDLAALFDTASNVPAETRLKTLTATAIVVPDVQIDDATAGSERHATITQLLLSQVVAGKIAAASTAGATFATKTGEENVSGSVGAIQASGVDLAQIARVFGTIRSDDAEPIRPLYDAVTITGIKIDNLKKNSTATIGALKETGARARPLKTDALTAKKAGTDTLTQEQKAALYQDMTHSFEIGSLEVTDVDGSGEGKLSLASASITAVANGKVGGFVLRALRLDDPKVKFGIASIVVGPFTLPPPKADAAAAPATSALMPSAVSIYVNQVDFDGEGKATDANPTPGRVRFAIGHAGFVSDGDPGELPKTSKLSLDNVSFDIPPGNAQPLIDMGYGHLDLSMGLATTYDGASQTLKMQDLTLNGVNMGKLALGLTLINVTKGVISPNQETVKASLLAVLAKAVTLNLANEGLIDRAIAWKAKQDGLDVAKEKEFLTDFFANKLPASVNGNANVKAIGDAIAQFVTNPKTLSISIVSKSGLGVGSMALLSDPGLLLDTLEVKASANQ